MKKLALKNLIELSSCVKVYIPSNSQGKAFDNSAIVQECAGKLSAFFGGSTTFDAFGCWLSANSELIREHITIVQSFCTQKALTEHIAAVVEYGQHLKDSLKQESIGIEVNNKFYLI